MPKTQTPQQAASVPPAQRAGTVEREFTVVERKQWQLIVRRFLRHRLAVASLILLIVLVVLAYALPHFWQYSPTVPTDQFRTGPSLKHPFGTDNTGFDYFARTLRGAQQSLKIAAIVALLSTAIGAPYGAVSGLIGGRVDALMMRLCDLLLVLPLLVVAAALASSHGAGVDTVMLVALILGLLGWPINARQVRGVVLGLREQEFVEASRAMGAGTWRIVFRHLLPNATGTIVVQATLDIAAAILAEAALSFLGLGVQAPDTSLGNLINQALTSVDTLPWLFYIPGIVIIVIALTINFIGDGLRDAFDPRQTRQRR